MAHQKGCGLRAIQTGAETHAQDLYAEVEKGQTGECMTDTLTILQGNNLETLPTLPPESVQCCVTSPPYWGLRSYLPAGHPLKPFEIGTEKTPEEYVAKLVAVFAQVRRVLKKDGTLWVNLGDSYAANRTYQVVDNKHVDVGNNGAMSVPPGLKQKDLVGIPWRVAFALQADGWYLRSDIIWAKRNCMPESVTDRPTRSHEYLFLLTKSPRYFYDHEAIKEPCIYDVDGTGTASRKARQKSDAKSLPTIERAGIRPGGFKDAEKMNGKHADKQRGHSRRHEGFNARWDNMEREEQCTGMRNKRDVWTIAPANYPEAHFATFPPDLIKPCILAGTKPDDTVLDPFGGSGTTGEVSIELGRRAILCELNPEYLPLIERRCDITPGFKL